MIYKFPNYHNPNKNLDIMCNLAVWGNNFVFIRTIIDKIK